MLAVDTNVLVRLAVRDDADQVARALAAISGRRFYVATTVLLELEWVLRRVLKLQRAEVVHVLRSLCGLKDAVVEQPERVRASLDDHEHGLDFADALHVRGARACEAFLTFDRKLVKAVSKLDGVPVREP